MANNNWVSEIALSFEQMMDQIRAKFETELPEITDQSDREKAIRLAQISAGLAEVTNILSTNLYRENFIGYSQLFESLVVIARGEDYRVKGSQAAVAQLRITADGPVSPGFSISDAIGSEGPLFGTEGGTLFRLTGAYNWPDGATELLVDVREQVLVQSLTQAGTGKYLQFVNLPEQTSESSILVKVNNVVALRVSSFAFDRDPSRVYYLVEMDENRNLVIRFGDDSNGQLPETGETIEVFYETCTGPDGNAAPGAINRIISGMPTVPGVTFEVENLELATGGRNPETPAEIRNSILRFKRTLDRAVTRQDFIDIALLHPKVRTAEIKAGCQRVYTLYVYGFGGPVAAPDLVSVRDFIAERCLIPREIQIEVVNVPEVVIKEIWDIIVKEGYNRVLTTQLARTAMVNYLSRDNSKIALEVRRGNLDAIMENVEGVEDTDLKAFFALPNAKPGTSNTTPNLAWTFSLVTTNINTARFILKFDTPTQYRVFRNGTYAANYTVGDEAFFPELSFVVSGSYAAGDQFGFYIYPYKENIAFQEIVIPIAEPGDIFINPTGGY